MGSKIAFIFPGQGSQFVGMAADLAVEYPLVEETLAEANEVLGLDLAGLMRGGPAEELTATEVAQPAILAHSVALWRVLERERLEPTMVAGHSLGEYSALVAAGGMEFGAALELVRERGLAMAAATREVGGTMLAVLGLEDAVVQAAVEEAAEEGVVVVANYNSPGQLVISGEEQAVERAGELAKAAGARGVMPLQVACAFHSPLMAPAAERMRERLAAVELRDTQAPLVSNVDAEPRQDAEAIREALQQQITGSVRWTESIRRMLAEGVERFVEVGPGEVLTKLMKRIEPGAEAFGTSDAGGAAAAIERLRAGN